MIQQIDKNGNVVKEWSCNVSDIAREIGCNRSVLQLALSGKRPCCKGYKWKSATDVATDDATPSTEDATTDILDATDATTEIRSLPTRLSIDWFMDINTDYKDEPYRESLNEQMLTDRENEYIDWIWEKISHLPVNERNKDICKGTLIYRDRNECLGEVASHLKEGFRYFREPAHTIRRACELVLLDLYMDKYLMDFKNEFNK